MALTNLTRLRGLSPVNSNPEGHRRRDHSSYTKTRTGACSRLRPRATFAGCGSPRNRSPRSSTAPAVDVSDAHELLLGYVTWYREALTRKLEGLSDDQLRTPVEPLGWVERRWMRWGFGAQNVVAYPSGGDAEEWTVAPDTSTAQVIAAYQTEVTMANAPTADAISTDKALLGGRFKTPEQAPTLGRILFHLLQEYARHVGHLDIACELIDGQTGE